MLVEAMWTSVPLPGRLFTYVDVRVCSCRFSVFGAPLEGFAMCGTPGVLNLGTSGGVYKWMLRVGHQL
jgi:hypothetical protein